MIVLDTNVISELMQVAPHAGVVEWIDRQPRDSIWTTTITIFEIAFGLETMTSGRKQVTLLHSFRALREKLEGRIALFDELAAEETAELMAERQKRGIPRDLRDTMIAGIVLAHRATLATRNVSHFADLSTKVVNPWNT